MQRVVTFPNAIITLRDDTPVDGVLVLDVSVETTASFEFAISTMEASGPHNVFATALVFDVTATPNDTVNLDLKRTGLVQLSLRRRVDGTVDVHEASLPIWLGPLKEGLDLQFEYDEASAQQRHFRNFEISAGNDSTNRKRHTVTVMLAGTLLDYRQVIEGGEIVPLNLDLGNESARVAANRILQARGLSFPVETDIAADPGPRIDPLTLAIFNSVLAADERTAVETVYPRLERIQGALSLERGATPRIVGYLAEVSGSNTVTLLNPASTYRGNLVPGFGGGAITQALDRIQRAAAVEPWIDFALNLFRSARTETNYPVQIFRAWSLVEAAAKRSIPQSNAPVTMRGHSALYYKGKPLTEKSDVGRVASYLDGRVGMSATHDGTGISFFDRILFTYRFRNMVAHEGGIQRPSADERSSDPMFWDFYDRAVWEVMYWAETSVEHEIAASLGLPTPLTMAPDMSSMPTITRKSTG